MKYYVFVSTLFLQFISFAQGMMSSIVSVPANVKENPHFSPLDGSGFLGQTYNKTLCGLSYVQSSKMITTRYNHGGSGFPCALPISGISSCYVIDKAYLYWNLSYKTGSSTSPMVRFTNPSNVTFTYPGTMIGQGQDKNWYVAGSRAFRADVTSSITGNGTYSINSITGHTDWEVDGATLIIIYRNTAASWKGTLIINDGIFTSCSFGNWGNTILGFTACASGINAASFLIISDMQDNILPNPVNATLNGVIVAFPKNFWNFVQTNTAIFAGQTSAYSGGLGGINGGDCFSVSVNGLYFQTITCGTCSSDLNVTAAATPAGNCTNGNSGTATANVTGGNSSYSYFWLPGGQTTQTINGLGAGTYSVVVTDQDCNKDTAIVTVSSSGALSASITQTNLKCFNVNNASAAVSASNGSSPYTYSWSNGSTTAVVSGLSSGTYTVTITDAIGCTAKGMVNITQPPPLSLSVTSVGTTCGKANGSVTPLVSGGTGTYTYIWSNGSTNSYAGQFSYPQNLAAGSYALTVTDANGCSKTVAATLSNSAASATFTQTSACLGAPVHFTNTGSAGTGVAYTWFITPGNVTGVTTNFAYTFLSAGTYSVSHTASIGTCKDSVNKTITVINCNAGPTVTTMGNSVCPGTCTAVASSGTGGTGPYTYSWSNGATTQNINSCPASTTTYTITVTDNTGATATSIASVAVNPAVTATTNSTNMLCSGGVGSILVSGGSGTSPYTYNWSNGHTMQTATGLTSGNYTVTVTDSKNCTTTATAVITSPTAIAGQFTKGTSNCAGCSCKEWLLATATGGTSPYSYSWTDGSPNRYKNQLCPGTYTINIKDKNGCNINVNLSAP